MNDDFFQVPDEGLAHALIKASNQLLRAGMVKEAAEARCAVKKYRDAKGLKGLTLLKELMAKHRIGVDLFESNFEIHRTIRLEIIRELHAAGLNRHEIGRLLHRDPSTISYWLTPGRREKRMEAMRRRGRNKKARLTIARAA